MSSYWTPGVFVPVGTGSFKPYRGKSKDILLEHDEYLEIESIFIENKSPWSDMANNVINIHPDQYELLISLPNQ